PSASFASPSVAEPAAFLARALAASTAASTALTCSASMTSCALSARGPNKERAGKNRNALAAWHTNLHHAALREAPAVGRPSVIRHPFASEESLRAAMRGDHAFRRTGGGRQRIPVRGQRLRQEVSVPGYESGTADENVTAQRHDDAQRRLMDVVERRLGEKQRLRAVGLHDRDILLIGRDQNADAARVRGADKLGPTCGQMP